MNPMSCIFFEIWAGVQLVKKHFVSSLPSSTIIHQPSAIMYHLSAKIHYPSSDLSFIHYNCHNAPSFCAALAARTIIIIFIIGTVATLAGRSPQLNTHTHTRWLTMVYHSTIVLSLYCSSFSHSDFKSNRMFFFVFTWLMIVTVWFLFAVLYIVRCRVGKCHTQTYHTTESLYTLNALNNVRQ